MIPAPTPDDPTVAVVHRAEKAMQVGDVMVTALNIDGSRHVAVELPDEPLTRSDATNVAALILQAATAA